MDLLEEVIRERAYYMWVASGFGKDVTHWLEAENAAFAVANAAMAAAAHAMELTDDPDCRRVSSRSKKKGSSAIKARSRKSQSWNSAATR
jgi:hypothetical protein